MSTTEVEIAVLKAELEGLRAQHKAHADDTKASINALAKEVKDLVAVMNRGKGAFGFAMMLASGLGAAAFALLHDLLGK